MAGFTGSLQIPSDGPNEGGREAKATPERHAAPAGAAWSGSSGSTVGTDQFGSFSGAGGVMTGAAAGGVASFSGVVVGGASPVEPPHEPVVVS